MSLGCVCVSGGGGVGRLFYECGGICLFGVDGGATKDVGESAGEGKE